jgi:hypothetical protein
MVLKKFLIMIEKQLSFGGEKTKYKVDR